MKLGILKNLGEDLKVALAQEVTNAVLGIAMDPSNTKTTLQSASKDLAQTAVIAAHNAVDRVIAKNLNQQKVEGFFSNLFGKLFK